MVRLEMEPIPEDGELATPSSSTKTTRLKEIYNSEKINTRVRTIPSEYLLTDNPEVVCDEKVMQANGVTDPYESESTAYTYSYESAFDDGDGGGDRSLCRTGDASTETTKVTRVTKVTTTKCVKHVPVHSPRDMIDAYYFNEEGPIVHNDAMQRNVHMNGSTYTSQEYSEHNGVDEAHSSASTDEGIHLSQRLANVALASTASPCPQAVDIDATQVTLVWQPQRDVVGYKVQYKHPADRQWHPAHNGLIDQPNCTLTNLEPNASLQFRVISESADGQMGLPSASTATVQLRAPDAKDALVLPCPSMPQISYINGHTGGGQIVCGLQWQPPRTSTNSASVVGYIVHYKAEGTRDWVQANDYLITECRFEVSGLRPEGVYSFQVTSRNSDGQSASSKPSAPVRITPSNVNNGGSLANGAATSGVTNNPPSQPEVIDQPDDASVTLEWTPPLQGARDVVGYIVESRQVGDTNWYSVDDRLITSCNVKVGGLDADGSYEFRVICQHSAGVSPPSDISTVVQLTRGGGGVTRGVPRQPTMPQIMEVLANQVTLCWSPTQSTLPVHGYDVEFVDVDDMPQTWCKVNEILMSACKMTISDLTFGHRYGFRVIAKNAIGYSSPSPLSEVVTIGQTDVSRNSVRAMQRDNMSGVLALQEELVRESPPLPDRDDSPPPIHTNMHNNENLSWRDPTLAEVLDYLSSPNNVIRLNAAGYLQHLTFNDNETKTAVRELGGVGRLVDLLESDIPEIQKNACGCLRNMCYGRQNDDNKRALQHAGGVQALVQLLRKTPDMHVKEEITGALWNLSSADELKRTVLECCSEVLCRQIILPGSGMVNTNSDREYNPNVFKNATGVLRNVSAATDSARKMLRDMPQLIDAIVFYLNNAVLNRGDYESRNVENCICVMRNLSYRAQEIDDPNYDQQTMSKSTGDLKHDQKMRSKSAPSGSPKLKHSLFRKSKTKSPSQSPYLQRPPKGVCLLWSEELIKIYACLLKNSSNGATLEASAGAIQNLSACYWEPSEHVRTVVRQEKVLPLFVELSRVADDRVVCAVTTAMRNLALDPKNRDLIGSYAMRELVAKLPPANQPRPPNVSDLTLCSVLALLYEIIKSSGEFTRSLDECGGTASLMYLCKSPHNQQYSQRVVRYAAHVLSTMWCHKEQHSALRHGGRTDADYMLPIREYGGLNATTTLARPISTQGPERPTTQSRLRPDLNDSTLQYSSIHPSTANGNVHTNGNGDYPAPQDDSPRSYGHYPMSPTVNHNHNNNNYHEPLYAAVHKSSPEDVYDGLYEEGKEGDSWV